jgi:tetratricopeptide (TPR) repeat protein
MTWYTGGQIMPQREPKPRFVTPLSQVLTDYLATHSITQLDLADYLNIGERTLRRWKNGEDMLTDIRELKRIAELLEVEPERLGVAASLYIPLTPDEIDTSIDHVWRLIRAAKYYEASVLVDRLIRDIASFIQTEDPILLRKLAHAQHTAGYIKSQTSRANKADLALFHYSEMERIARILDDQTLINIALSYEGDMLQRGGNVKESIQYLEAARDTTPHADVSARGNGIQLLGRAYFKAGRLGDFEYTMKEAEALAYESQTIDLSSDSVKGQYGLGTVYEEWGRSLGLLGQTNGAIEYLDKAEHVFSQTWTVQRRDMLIKTARAMTLVRNGEIRQGIELAVEAIDLCRKQGNVRLLDRVYGIQRHLDQLTREIGNAGSMLREALAGPIEY